MYDEWYFERKYKYSKKKHAIQRHYLDMLMWANRYTTWNLLEGTGKRALDIGCAYGFVADLFKRLGYEALGTDVSKYAVTKGRKMSEANLLISDAQHLPFKSPSFDVITCFELLEHLPSPTSTLAWVHKILRSGGVLIATTPNVGVVATIISILAREPFSTTHPSVKSLNEWVEILSKSRFSVVKVEPFLLLPVPPTLFDRYFVTKCTLRLASHIKLLALKGSHKRR
ncbi:MAG: class I SAM-dependent methyltransferase [Methanocellales archaeon]|nr:class I SAM-dependent methyltransferase [Methanocellales archaeon]